MPRRQLLSLLLTILLLIALSPSLLAGDPLLKVHFLDVGQADCILVQVPPDYTILIDAGNNADAWSVIDYIKLQGITQLDHVIGTHPHEDHIGGLDVVIQTFDVGKLYMPKVSYTTDTYRDVLLAAKAKGLKITRAMAGVELDVGPHARAVILAPNSTHYEDVNNYSAVLKLTYGETAFLFTGDAEAESETEMLNAGYDLRADVLKVGHHGSNSSTTEAFLKAVSPKYAVISVGRDNRYGLPDPQTLDRLAAAGVEVYRTDEVGTIVATSDGKIITFDKKASPIKERAPNTSTVEIISIDLRSEVVTIQNNGDAPADISGWRLVSERGGQVFIFPPGTVIPPGGIIRVVSGKYAQPGPNTLVWTKRYIWNNNGDPGSLYDAEGKLVSRYE